MKPFEIWKQLPEQKHITAGMETKYKQIIISKMVVL